jgi:hypothetical protein
VGIGTLARRLIALVLAAGLPALAIASIWVEWRVAGGDYSSVGYAVFALGALISVANFYVSFVRPNLVRAFASDQSSTRHVSGVPLLGMLTVPALAFVPPNVGLSVACLGLVLAVPRTVHQ